MSWAPDRDSSWAKKVNRESYGLIGALDRMLFNNDPVVNEPGDIARQTASEGGERNIIYGRVRPIGGNLIHAQTPYRRWKPSIIEGTGKGSDEPQVQWTLRAYRTYAIGICEGPITGIIRVWRNDQLVYDARGNEWGVKNNPVFLERYRIHLGSFDQNPDPALEAVWGVGQVPAYRGTAYIVAPNEDLTDLGGAVPQFMFEVERSEGTYLTSRPYAVESLESMLSLPMSRVVGINEVFESLSSGQYGIASGSLLQVPLAVYNYNEEFQSEQYTISSGSLEPAPNPKYFVPEESIDAGQYSVLSIEIKEILITYDDWPAEKMQAGQYTITGGTLS